MIRFNRLNLDQARAALAPMVGNPKWDTSDGLAGVDDLIGGGVAFEAFDDAGPLGVFVVDQVKYANGTELEVRVGRQFAACGDLTERVLPEIEARFGHGCDSVAIWTRRPGLVHKLRKAGYGAAAAIMRKEL